MIIAVTGHRPNKLGGFGDDQFLLLQSFAIGILSEIKPDKVITGMALGWDQAIAAACAAERIPFIAACPCDNQDSKWPPASRAIWNELMRKASERVIVSPGAYTNQCMQVRNEWMVDRCDKLISLWNGTLGGTANCITYAQSKGKDIENYWERYKVFMQSRKSKY